MVSGTFSDSVNCECVSVCESRPDAIVSQTFGYACLYQAFTIMDQNRDGFIDKNDLRDTYAALGT